ncbi:hypothetical protein IPA_06875 [Ignicoccus pacificus DSM 13166]|uniref:Peptidase M50 domain-containing protein n=1 Tax=Ignicoccus pacificus DSM 13166 TaxID=940294 RepID=A0A977PK97_9CREN|nr:hypothetical protein IPA_06875 [Ignicoccus pacificus DSM 13166]
MRNGEHIYSPFPGLLLIRIRKLETKRIKPELSIINRIIIDTLTIMFILAFLFGMYILLTSLEITETEILLITLLFTVLALYDVMVLLGSKRVPTSNDKVVKNISKVSITVPLAYLPFLVAPSFTVLAAPIIIFIISIVVHELAHYWSAIKQGISVSEVGVGFFLFLAIFYVRVNIDTEDLSTPQKVVPLIETTAAGPGVNMLMALLIVTLLLFKGPGIYITHVEKDSFYQRVLDLRTGDVVLSINEKSIKSVKELERIIIKGLQKHNSIVLKVEILRNGRLMEGDIILIKYPLDDRTVVYYKHLRDDVIGLIVLPRNFEGISAVSYFSLPVIGIVPLPDDVYTALLVWIFINLFSALFNALPLFITDGGKVTMILGEFLGSTYYDTVYEYLWKYLWVFEIVLLILVFININNLLHKVYSCIVHFTSLG